MIERLQIRDFQRHDRLRVKFDERTTTIIGPSDTGKSSIMRAIRWLAFNRPLGDSFVRNGQDSCSVKLWVDDRKLERRKDKRSNQYLIDGKELSAVGTDVPEQVRQLLNLTPDNFQGQHEPPFWFSLTAGEVAKRLNSIVDLEVIDRSAAWLSSKLKAARAELGIVEARAVEAKAEVDRLEFVDDLRFDFDRVGRLGKKTDKAREEWDDLVRALKQARQRGQEARTGRSAATAAGNTLELADAAEAVHRRLMGLSDLVANAKAACDAAARKVPDIGELESCYNRIEDITESRKLLKNVLTNLRLSAVRMEDARMEWGQAMADLDDKTEGVCPLCGGELR
jgi:DNA repair protein SbcC/Rad50